MTTMRVANIPTLNMIALCLPSMRANGLVLNTHVLITPRVLKVSGHFISITMDKTTQYTLLWGTANPEGMQNYKGIYLNEEDIQDMISQVESANSASSKIPVLVEHKGIEVGHVVSAWNHQGKLECVLALDNKVLEGSIGSEFVKSGICKDLSLGYDVSLENSKAGIRVGRKKLKEISIVKKGARPRCHIHGVSR